MSLAVTTASVLLGGCASTGSGPAPDGQAGTPVDRSTNEDPVTAAASTGPLGSSSGSCVEEYTSQAVTRRGFAFDGTVTSIEAGTTNRPGKGRLNTVAVTFAVDTWYVGGSGSHVTIDMAPPGDGPRVDEVASTYDLGTRLLVSGESRWGEGVLHDGLAWGCGFTRYYDTRTADEWRASTD